MAALLLLPDVCMHDRGMLYGGGFPAGLNSSLNDGPGLVLKRVGEEGLDLFHLLSVTFGKNCNSLARIISHRSLCHVA